MRRRIARYRRRGFSLFCLDECTIVLGPYLVRGWALRGSRPVARVNQLRYKFHMTGARSRRGFVYAFNARQNQSTFIRFLKKLLALRRRVLCLIDSAPWHRGKKVKQFLKENKHRLKIIHFPYYSPELNPVEPCWTKIKEPLANRYFKTIGAMKQATRRHLKKNTNTMPQMFQYLCP